ncbi:MAG: hypothetical protein ACK452_00245, partial [Bacteroidota bacterium]
FIISKTGKQTINPDQTTVYKIVVTALDCKTIIEKYLTVEVFEEGQISFFKSDRQYVYPTVPVTLSWEVINALKVEIEGLGDFQLVGTTPVYPTQDDNYKIIVTDNFGKIEKTIQIKMLPLPIIERLTIPTPNISINSSISITIPQYQSQSSQQFNFTKVCVYNSNIELKNKLNPAGVKPIELNHSVEKITFFHRIRNLYKILIKEFNNELNRKYAIKK